jgi:glycosyltransferase involved in cell wall biosynthesis
VIVLSERWRTVISQIEPESKIAVLPNPVVTAEHSAQPIGHRVLFLGRLREKKGVYDLIRCLPELSKLYPDVVFVLAGDGELDQVAALAEQLGVKQHIELTGWIAGEDKQKALASADVFVLPSYFEGLPVCILEAMAQGVPVISTDVGGIPDICRDGIDGLLVKPGDLVALTSAFARLFADMQLKQALIASARARIDTEFAMPVVLSHLGDIYLQLGAQPK